MKMIKRLYLFGRRDWCHVFWLLGNAIKEYSKGNTEEAVDALYWIRIHMSYDSERIDQ